MKALTERTVRLQQEYRIAHKECNYNYVFFQMTEMTILAVLERYS